MLPRLVNKEESTLTVFRRAIATHLARTLEKSEQEIVPIVQLNTTFHRSGYSIFLVVLKRLGPLDDATTQKCLELGVDTREYIRGVRLVKGLLLFDPDTTQLVQLTVRRIYKLLGPEEAQTHAAPAETEQPKSGDGIEIALGKRPRDRAEDPIVLVDGSKTQEVENAYSSLRRIILVGVIARMATSSTLSLTKVILDKNDYNSELSLFNELDIVYKDSNPTLKELTSASTNGHEYDRDYLGIIRKALQDNSDIKAVFKTGEDGSGTWTVDLSTQRLGQNVKVFTSTANSVEEPTALIKRIISLAKQFEDYPACSRYLWIVPDASRQFAERALYLAKAIFHERPDSGSERTRPWPQLIEPIYYGPVSGSLPVLGVELSDDMTKADGGDYAKILHYANARMREQVVENRGEGDLDDDDDDSRPAMDEEKVSRLATILSLSALSIACTGLRRERKLSLDMIKVLSGKGSNGIFLQYMLSRLCGIERKATVELDPGTDVALLCPYPESLHLAVLIAEWEDVVLSVRDSLEPSLLVNLLFEIASQVGQANRVLRVKGMGDSVAKARWLLFWAAKRVLEESFTVFGLESAKEMRDGHWRAVRPLDFDDSEMGHPNKRHSFELNRSSNIAEGSDRSILRNTSRNVSSCSTSFSEDEDPQEPFLGLAFGSINELDDWYDFALDCHDVHQSHSDLTTTLDSLQVSSSLGSMQFTEQGNFNSELDLANFSFLWPPVEIPQLELDAASEDHSASQMRSSSPLFGLHYATKPPQITSDMIGQDKRANLATSSSTSSSSSSSSSSTSPSSTSSSSSASSNQDVSTSGLMTSSVLGSNITSLTNETLPFGIGYNGEGRSSNTQGGSTGNSNNSSASNREVPASTLSTTSIFGSDLASFASTFLPLGFDDNGYAIGSYNLNSSVGSTRYSNGTEGSRDRNRSVGESGAEANSELHYTRNGKAILSLLDGIESNEEAEGEKRISTPEGMAPHIELYEYQKAGLAWLQSKEAGPNRGGILGDDMGLGKTLQAISLIVSRPAESIQQTTDWSYASSHLPPEEARMPIKTTLVIVPLALMYQWQGELERVTRPGHLKVFVYYGRDRFERGTRTKISPKVLSEYDALKDDFCKEEHLVFGPLCLVKFHRVVIDEAHEIKNHRTKASQACAALAADYRWCLTGTPIQNNIVELYSLIRFLRIEPYCEWREFQKTFTDGKNKSTQAIFQRVQVLLKAICLRRTKSKKIDNKPILVLPTRHFQKHTIQFSEDERAFYTALNDRTQRRVNAYLRQGTMTKNYSCMLQLLLRLRQACCHPHLIKDLEVVEKPQNVQDLLNGLVQSVLHRLLENDTEAAECPICMDVNDDNVILNKCGHVFCRDCITAHLSLRTKNVGPCPQCRAESSLIDFIPVKDFNRRFKPESLVDSVSDGETEDDKAIEDVDPWLSSSKVIRMIEIVEDAKAKGEKTVVFSQFTGFLSVMERPLREKGIGFLRYDGKMDAKARNEAVQKMSSDPRYSVILVSLKCGAMGLNLTAANHVILMDPWWNPAVGNQAIDRIYRIGQTREVYVHQLCVEDTVEDRILTMQIRKQDMINSALGEGGASQITKFGVNELLYLFRG
ncbi:hypothetical protein BGW38_003000 [Lunasporangiospora selenospora]|uniref:Uncharacterized protein n=1 Tax=Lunasporangiospora selenospora TaxID=979761 RepID=A0A9P6G3F9_9FUNG|nr:hypothetical protein BGW38_003000 [Lunasporangiospora selenospora]